MCVALFLYLGLSGWGAQELAAIYLLIYLTLFYTGPGKFSSGCMVGSGRTAK